MTTDPKEKDKRTTDSEQKSEKKLTETEELKLNTRIQKAKDQAEGISQYLVIRLKMMMALKKRSMQSIGVALLCLIVSILLQVKGFNVLGTIFNILWFVFFFVHLWLENMESRASGEFDGAYQILVLLGHAEDDDEPTTKKRKMKKKSWFARPKELFERMTKSKEAYGT